MSLTTLRGAFTNEDADISSLDLGEKTQLERILSIGERAD